MAAPRASAGRLDVLSLLQQAFTGMMAPQREDGLKALSLQNGSTGNSSPGMSSRDVIASWNSLPGSSLSWDEIYNQNPNSQFGQWFRSIGAAPGQGGTFARQARHYAALGGNYGGGGGGSAQDWLPGFGGKHSLLGKLF